LIIGKIVNCFLSGLKKREITAKSEITVIRERKLNELRQEFATKNEKQDCSRLITVARIFQPLEVDFFVEERDF